MGGCPRPASPRAPTDRGSHDPVPRLVETGGVAVPASADGEVAEVPGAVIPPGPAAGPSGEGGVSWRLIDGSVAYPKGTPGVIASGGRELMSVLGSMPVAGSRSVAGSIRVRSNSLVGPSDSGATCHEATVGPAGAVAANWSVAGSGPSLGGVVVHGISGGTGSAAPDAGTTGMTVSPAPGKPDHCAPREVGSTGVAGGTGGTGGVGGVGVAESTGSEWSGHGATGESGPSDILGGTGAPGEVGETGKAGETGATESTVPGLLPQGAPGESGTPGTPDAPGVVGYGDTSGESGLSGVSEEYGALGGTGSAGSGDAGHCEPDDADDTGGASGLGGTVPAHGVAAGVGELG